MLIQAYKPRRSFQMTFPFDSNYNREISFMIRSDAEDDAISKFVARISDRGGGQNIYENN